MRRVLSGAGILGLLALSASVSPAALTTSAATPANGSITAPSSGTVTLSWAGTALPNTGNSAIRCFAFPNRDVFDFNLAGVSDAYYKTRLAYMTVRIDWTPSTPANQVGLGVDRDTAQFPGTSEFDTRDNLQDGNNAGQNYQSVTYVNPPVAVSPAFWEVSVCGVANATPQDYKGTVTLSVQPLSTRPEPVHLPQVANAPRLTNYESPAGFETRDVLQRPAAGEPSIGVNWKTGAVIDYESTQDARITFDDSRSPATAKWENVAPTKQRFANEDPIGYTDPVTGRAFSVGLLLACSNVDFSDDDGASWTPSTGCPIPHSPDHESLVSGPPAPGAVVRPTGNYPNMVYYCSQNILQVAGAFCGHSEDGGILFDVPSTMVFGPGTPCGAIHGHLRVSPDGTLYLPQSACTRPDGISGQGMAISHDDGVTYTYGVVSDSTNNGTGGDPSVAADAANNVYFAYVDGTGKIKAAISHDHGVHWDRSVNVGKPFNIENAEFPEVIAGDAGRAAVAFLGTNKAGDDQAADFSGVWYLYVSYTYDGGKSWTTVNATPNDPVQRGCVDNAGAGSGACPANFRNMLDFNDITVDKKGRVLVAYTDGCTADCETNPKIDASGCPGQQGEGTSETSPIDSTPTCTPGRHTAVVRQSCGVGLFAAYDGQLGGDCYPFHIGQLPQVAVSGAQSGASGNLPNTAAAQPWRGLPSAAVTLAFALLALPALAAAAIVAASRRYRGQFER